MGPFTVLLADYMAILVEQSIYRNNLISKRTPICTFFPVMSLAGCRIFQKEKKKSHSHELLYIEIQPSKAVLLCLAKKLVPVFKLSYLTNQT